jgi:hypothetical protein
MDLRAELAQSGCVEGECGFKPEHLKRQPEYALWQVTKMGWARLALSPTWHSRLLNCKKTVLVMDTGFGLGNLDILLSSTPQYREVGKVFQKWHRAAQQLLEIIGHRDLHSGGIPRHIQVPQALRRLNPVVGIYPQCPNRPGVPPMSHGDLCIATTISPSGQRQFFWQRLFR